MTEPSADELVEAIYVDLRSIARRERYKAGSPPTLQTTAIINEAYLKLRRSGGWNDRHHFLCVAATAMRQVLVDDARARLSAKRGFGERPSELDEAAMGVAGAAIDDGLLLDVDAALAGLAAVRPRLAQIVEFRFFAGYTDDECADVLGVTTRTVVRDWVKARAWLFHALKSGRAAGP